MTEREAFELWYGAHTVERGWKMRDKWEPEAYAPPYTQTAWWAWQASRKQALEEAAQAVEALRDDHCSCTQRDPDSTWHCHADDGAGCDFVAAWNDASAAIRSLSTPDTEGGKG